MRSLYFVTPRDVFRTSRSVAVTTNLSVLVTVLFPHPTCFKLAEVRPYCEDYHIGK